MTELIEIAMSCKRPACEHAWKYTGEKRYPGLVNCPYCGNKTRVPEEI